MRDMEGKGYADRVYRTGTVQKRKREAADKVRVRRTSRRKAKNKLSCT